MKAIVIEPSRSYRKLLAGLLRHHGIESIEAGDAAEMRGLLEGAPVDLVCMAMTLPDDDTAKLAMQIRASPGWAKVPILMLTSRESGEETRRCLAAGVTELFRKQDIDAFGDYLGRLAEQLSRHGTAGGRILYLEDTKAVALATTRILVENGFQVDQYARAEDGIEAFKAREYDLVLTDIVLEGRMTGAALLEAVRRHDDPTRRTVPVIAMSGHDDAARRLQLFRAGVNDYVTKPVLPEELVARASALVANRRLTSKLAESHAHLHTIAMTDQLSGLFNRHYLMEEAPLRLGSALKANQPLSLMVVDLDHFKAINDRHGHAAGDEVLVGVGNLLGMSAHSRDLAARFGGEEFILLVGNCALEEALQRADAVREQIAGLRFNNIGVTASIGVAELRIGESYDKLFKRADKAVYAAKSSGRNRVVAG